MIPLDVKRAALSEIINHLLGNKSKGEGDGEGEMIMFDFLIDGVMLRTSLGQFLEKRGISTVRKQNFSD